MHSFMLSCPDNSVVIVSSDADHEDSKAVGGHNDAECEEDTKGPPMNWGDNALGASTLLAKRLIRSISGPDFDLFIYVAGAVLVVVDARTAQRCVAFYDHNQLSPREQAKSFSPRWRRHPDVQPPLSDTSLTVAHALNEAGWSAISPTPTPCATSPTTPRSACCSRAATTSGGSAGRSPRCE
jgi:hypothetical protein